MHLPTKSGEVAKCGGGELALASEYESRLAGLARSFERRDLQLLIRGIRRDHAKCSMAEWFSTNSQRVAQIGKVLGVLLQVCFVSLDCRPKGISVRSRKRKQVTKARCWRRTSGLRVTDFPC